jgi:hypothetical protein
MKLWFIFSAYIHNGDEYKAFKASFNMATARKGYDLTRG